MPRRELAPVAEARFRPVNYDAIGLVRSFSLVEDGLTPVHRILRVEFQAPGAPRMVTAPRTPQPLDALLASCPDPKSARGNARRLMDEAF